MTITHINLESAWRLSHCKWKPEDKFKLFRKTKQLLPSVEVNKCIINYSLLAIELSSYFLCCRAVGCGRLSFIVSLDQYMWKSVMFSIPQQIKMANCITLHFCKMSSWCKYGLVKLLLPLSLPKMIGTLSLISAVCTGDLYVAVHRSLLHTCQYVYSSFNINSCTSTHFCK